MARCGSPAIEILNFSIANWRIQVKFNDFHSISHRFAKNIHFSTPFSTLQHEKHTLYARAPPYEPQSTHPTPTRVRETPITKRTHTQFTYLAETTTTQLRSVLRAYARKRTITIPSHARRRARVYAREARTSTVLPDSLGSPATMPVTQEDLKLVDIIAARLVPKGDNPAERDDVLSDGAAALPEAVAQWDTRPDLRAKYGRGTIVGRVVRRRIIDGIRHRHGVHGDRTRLEKRALRMDDADADVTPGQVERGYSQVIAEQMLSGLPSREREIVQRTVLDGETEAAVGASLGISESRVSLIRARALQRLNDGPRQAPSDILTQREHDILKLVADGGTNGEIASILHLSEETIKTHIRHALPKLGARNRAHAVAIALRKRIIT